MASKAGKSDKAGRNTDYCRFYAATFRREKNKLKRVNKHLKRHPGDLIAVKTVANLKARV